MKAMQSVDRDIMKRFIWRKTYPAGDTFTWANGGDGPIVVSVTPIGDDPRTGIDIEIAVALLPQGRRSSGQTSRPASRDCVSSSASPFGDDDLCLAVTLKDVYDYYRTQDMTWEEWSRYIRADVFGRRYAELLGDVKDVSQILAKYSGGVSEVVVKSQPRISVDAGSGAVVVDDSMFSGIDYESCLIVKVLVEASGNWVSRREMQESEPQLQLVARIDRKIDHIQENHKAVGGLIERQSKGFRIRPQMFG